MRPQGVMAGTAVGGPSGAGFSGFSVPVYHDEMNRIIELKQVKTAVSLKSILVARTDSSFDPLKALSTDRPDPR